jgi:predicted nucleic acid-binding protein
VAVLHLDLPELLDELDVGEAAVISLVEARGIPIVLMDDRAGRRGAPGTWALCRGYWL